MSNEPATATAAQIDPNSAQDVNNRIEAALFASDDDEPKNNDDDVVSDDDQDIDTSTLNKDDDEVDDDQDADDDDTDSDDDDGSDLEDIATDEELSLADYLGIPEENLLVNDEGAVAFKAVIDGEAQEVPLVELAKSYQLQGHVNNKSIALENERKEFREQRETALGDIKTRLQGVEKLTELAEDELVADFKKIDWDQLRVQKPEEWSARRQEFAERAQKIKQTKALVEEESGRITEEQAKEIYESQKAILEEELNKTIVNNPTWADPEVRKADQKVMRDFLNTTYGYSDEDFATVMDSRLISLIQDAQKFRQGKQIVKKKVTKKVPKFRKPGANRKNASSLAKARNVKAKRDAVKKDGGSVRSVANLLEDRM